MKPQRQSTQSLSTAELLIMPEVIAVTRRSRSSILRDIKAGKFPKPVRTGSRSIAFRKNDVDFWMENLPTS